MYKLTFTLKQHTPIIHFQHDQEGATLRASELKPKLDKYLDSLAFDYDFEKMKFFMSGYDGKNSAVMKKNYESGRIALDYKISIRTNPDSIRLTDIPERFPCFFGNMGDANQENPKRFSFTDEPVQINFSSNHSDLIRIISAEIPNFFARNNFGTRQSKGFGSFYIHEKDERYEAEPALLSFFSLSDSRNTPENIFKDIELIHKVLRSGINDIDHTRRSTFYMKPLIWEYFRKKNINWDKRAIKKHFYPADLESQILDHDIEKESVNHWPITYDSSNYKMVKDLLGLSSLENWRVPYKMSISKSSETIDRFKSPVFYKPIRINNSYRIYIDSDYIPEEFFNSTFKISNGKKEFSLTTPMQEDFEISDFLVWAFTETNIIDHIPDEYTETAKARRIEKIFNELSANINI